MVSMICALPLALLLVGLADAGSCPADRAAAQQECNGRLGCSIPVCEGGEYRAFQCTGSVCYCVTTSGQTIGDYSFAIYEQSDCGCARAQVAGENIICADDGSSLPSVS